MVGDFVDGPGEQLNQIGRFYKPWFYEHVRSIANAVPVRSRSLLCTTPAQVEILPIRDWYHRHTKSIFWELNDIIPGGNHWALRYLVGWMLPPKVSFLKLTTTGPIRELYEKQHVIQDMLVPLSCLYRSLECFRRHYSGLYPIWVCPFKLHRVKGFVHPQPLEDGEELYVDLGAYGVPDAARLGKFDAIRAGRAVEEYVRQNRGFQMLYADTYMNRQEFREMFDHSLYDELRTTELQAAFPDVFYKVCKASNSVGFDMAPKHD
eukprot:TRINITY_DN12001_c0_g2_i4.p1 TRINITY_DN12001_c0_g2~~TRINITY_DN12001_c0_g2_i4.p1  ORF type:complete len:263 (+),score=38.53 TRINITY_DN12001_c0_g2_i4:161-949(+)